jgi:hypothetical protein
MRLSYYFFDPTFYAVVVAQYLSLYFTFSGSAAQRELWPPLSLQPSAGYGLLWLCSPARAMASSFHEIY